MVLRERPSVVVVDGATEGLKWRHSGPPAGLVPISGLGGVCDVAREGECAVAADNDVTFLDEFLTPEFAIRHKLFAFEWNGRNDRYEIATREFKAVKEKLLFQLTNFGNPFIYVDDANYENRGELLLTHAHSGIDLRNDYAKEVLAALVRVWKRPVSIQTKADDKPIMLRFDGKEHSSKSLK